MDRAGRAIDKLEEALKAGCKQDPNESQININTGNHSPVNYAVNGGTIINEAALKPKTPGNPNLVDCPDCGNLVSWRSNACPGCGLNVEKHFHQIFSQKQQAKNFKLLVGLFSGILLGLGIKFSGFEQVSWLGDFIIFGTIMSIVALGKLIENGKV